MDKQHFNYGSWTKGHFSEAATVTGPGKMIFLAGVGAEHEETGEIQHVGDFTAQCRYGAAGGIPILGMTKLGKRYLL